MYNGVIVVSINVACIFAHMWSFMSQNPNAFLKPYQASDFWECQSNCWACYIEMELLGSNLHLNLQCAHKIPDGIGKGCSSFWYEIKWLMEKGTVCTGDAFDLYKWAEQNKTPFLRSSPGVRLQLAIIMGYVTMVPQMTLCWKGDTL